MPGSPSPIRTSTPPVGSDHSPASMANQQRSHCKPSSHGEGQNCTGSRARKRPQTGRDCAREFISSASTATPPRARGRGPAERRARTSRVSARPAVRVGVPGETARQNAEAGFALQSRAAAFLRALVPRVRVARAARRPVRRVGTKATANAPEYARALPPDLTRDEPSPSTRVSPVMRRRNRTSSWSAGPARRRRGGQALLKRRRERITIAA